MGGHFSRNAKITRGADQGTSHQVHPDTIDKHPRSQRVIPAGQMPCVGQAATTCQQIGIIHWQVGICAVEL